MTHRLLVTGATGFIGRALAAHFAARGDFVLATHRADHPDLPGVQWISIAANPDTVLCNAFRDHALDAILHTAGRINGAHAEVIAANEGHTDDLLAAIARMGVAPAIYYLSSVSAIGPQGSYGESKRRAEAAIAARAPGRWAALRASLLYGAHEDRKNVAMLVGAARRWPVIPVIGGSAVKLQPLYVKDLIPAFEALLQGRGADGAIYTVAGPRQERLNDMIRAIQDRIGRHAPVVPVPLGPVRAVIGAADRVAPWLKLPAQQIRTLHDHPMYRSDEAARDLGFAPRLFAEGVADYL